MPSTKTTLPRAVRKRSAFSARYSSESYQRRACSMVGNSVTTRLGFQPLQRLHLAAAHKEPGTENVLRAAGRDAVAVLAEQGPEE